MCFVLKLAFPGKNNGTIKGDKCLVGQQSTHAFAQSVLKFGEKPLTAWLPGLGQRTRLPACRELCGCHLGPLEALVQSILGAVFRWVSLCSCLPAVLPEGAQCLASLGNAGSEGF